MGSALGREGRALHNANLDAANFWAPDVNPFRDPRYGRGQETGGEDAFVNAEVAIEYVLGLQDGPATRDEIQATAACKHILMYDSQTVRLNAEFRCGKSRPNAALGNSPRPTRTIGTSRGRISLTVRDDALSA